MQSDREIFVDWLKRSIKVDGLIKGKDLAKRLGIHPSTISGWFGKKRSKGPKIDMRLKICEILGKSYEKIINDYRGHVVIDATEEPINVYNLDSLKKHHDIIKRFIQHDKALLMNSLAVELEGIEPGELDNIIMFLKERLQYRRVVGPDPETKKSGE